ncbi:MAG: bile acid:sodium symporter family protein [Bacteroidales bacterium]|nr:bile acid:sodium symporter family protein [Bacteroidales bacterium]
MKILNLIKRYVAVLVLMVAVVAFVEPMSFSWIKTSYINWMLGVIMLCMGMTLNPKDFKIVFTNPKNVFIGCLAQFTVMPGLAWLLTKIFDLPADLAIGVVLVGCCPGGTASNVIAYLAKGDLALSVGMTAVSTILAPIVTPLECLLLADTMVEVNVLKMFLSIVQVVIVPILLGLFIQHFFPKQTAKIVDVLPAMSSIVIALIVGSVVSANSVQLHQVGIIVLLVVVLHNLFGFALGFCIGSFLKLPIKKSIAISIEVGMQNSGLACSLAQQHFTAMQMATVPGAIFSVWHNIAGAIVAKVYTSKLFTEK